LESCDNGKVYLCGDCVKDWDKIYEWSGLEAHSYIKYEGKIFSPTHKDFIQIWDKIFYTWLQGIKRIPTWKELVTGDTFVLS
jgi:hypothetical protein